MRAQALGQREHLGGAGHLEVEHRGHRGGDGVDVGVLDVPAVLAKMRGDAVGAGALADADGVRRVRARRRDVPASPSRCDRC